MPINLSSFSGTFQSYELDVEYYHGKDLVHQGCSLKIDPEYSWERIDMKIRNRIKKAKKLDVEIKRVKGTEQDIKDFRTIWFDPEDATIPPHLEDDEFMYLAYKDGKLIGGTILTPSTPTVLYLHNLGSNEEGKKHNIPGLVLWHAVEDLKDTQYKYIDVGVSFRPTLYRFFKRWQTDSYPIIFTPPFIKPDIRLTPFSAQDLVSYKGESSAKGEEVVKQYFGEDFTFLPRAIYALKALLKHIGIEKGDNVAIYKTFDNDYISGCVTNTIEHFGSVTRKINDKTKAVVVIHEFGFPYKDTKKLKKECEKRGIPLIEDCAWSYDSMIDAKSKVGDVGDYAIYSLPKILPVQYGAIVKGLKITDEEAWEKYQMLDFFKRELMFTKLETLLPKMKSDTKKRRANWEFLKNLFERDGIKTFVELEKGVSPAVFFMSTERYQEYFERYEQFGVEAGRYYQGGAMFLPVHQNLSAAQLEYIYAVYRGSLNLSSNYHRNTKS